MMQTIRCPRGNLIRTGTSVVAVLALAACGTQVAGGSGAEPPLLRIGAAGAIVAAADSVGSNDSSSRSAQGDAISLEGPLPVGPASASVRRFGAGQTPEDRVRDLATALGLTPDPVRRAHGWEVTSASGVLHVRDADGEWSFSRGGLECPAYLVDVESPSGGGSAVSCAVAVGDQPVHPTPALPVPTDEVAEALAKRVLAAADTSGDERVLPHSGELTRTVVVDPVVAGLPTVGLRTSVDVDRLGVVAAYGRIGTSTEGATYPLVSARTAYDRLAATPRPLPALACLESKDVATSCPAPVPVVVTGAVLGLELTVEDGGSVLVPAWLFSVRDIDEPLVAVAVEPRYLADPAPVTTPGSAPGDAPGSGSGSVPAPGSSGGSEPVPPATGAPVEPPTEAPPLQVAITSASVSADGRSLTLTGFGGVCATYSGSLDQGESSVKAQIVGVSTIGPDEGCIDLAKEVAVPVTLSAPLGSRTLLDTTTGETIAVARG